MCVFLPHAYSSKVHGVPSLRLTLRYILELKYGEGTFENITQLYAKLCDEMARDLPDMTYIEGIYHVTEWCYRMEVEDGIPVFDFPVDYDRMAVVHY